MGANPGEPHRSNGRVMPATRTVRIGMVAPGVVLLPLWVALEEGEFDRRHIAVTTDVIGSTEKTSNALLQEQIDLALTAPDAALADPDAVNILAAFADRPPLSLIAQPGIATVDELAGCTVGTTSLREGTVQLVRAILSEHGLRFPGDYTFVQAGAHPQRWEALQSGQITAALQLMPYDYLAEQAGFAVLAHAEDYVPFFAFASGCVRTEWRDDNPELASDILAALRVGERYIRERPDAAAAIAARLARIDEDHARRCVTRLVVNGVMPPALRHDERALERTRQAMLDSADLPVGL
jgi:ABC-type nitrate/sulfonate/bicarbonate transport system substrate-binding protein